MNEKVNVLLDLNDKYGGNRMSNLSSNLQHRKEVAKERLLICHGCEKYVSSTTQCKECGCIMLLKTVLASSVCPLSKWSADETVNKEE